MSRTIRTQQHATPRRLVCSAIHQIQAHLRRVFAIPPGNELALILAPEVAPGCNDHALLLWLRSQLAEIASHPTGENLLVLLEMRLLKTLQEAYPEIGMEVDVPSPLARRSNLPLPYWQEMSQRAPRRQSWSEPQTRPLSLEPAHHPDRKG